MKISPKEQPKKMTEQELKKFNQFFLSEMLKQAYANKDSFLGVSTKTSEMFKTVWIDALSDALTQKPLGIAETIFKKHQKNNE
jgi:Rod binding domain-containing protein